MTAATPQMVARLKRADLLETCLEAGNLSAHGSRFGGCEPEVRTCVPMLREGCVNSAMRGVYHAGVEGPSV
jgi:hypothetical protein